MVTLHHHFVFSDWAQHSAPLQELRKAGTMLIAGCWSLVAGL
jgi:hypothetical protein